ncbi:XdhC family protein [Lichenicoccus sp.]|uniref:XdhC family protein n=1 Tax=Lichenicoccus sp. TaxID=2781899 RepID=UPI003D0C5F9F
MTPRTLRALAEARQQRRLAVLLTRLADGAQHLMVEAEGLPETLPAPLLEAARRAAGAGRSGAATIEGDAWFVQVHAPAPRLVLIGAVHVAQALAPLARTLGMMVSVVDPRSGFATAERFPDVALLELWPDEAMAQLRPDAHTAIVTLSHEARLDDPALHAALSGPAFYVGALGSRRTQAARRERLAALGHDANALARLHGPVGLAIGAIGPQEIALSIIAEIVAVRRGAVRREASAG